jgi:nucleotide-binding universal stress UspA family protein
MFHRLLVPTDGSPRDDEAIALARHLADRFAASIVLLRVETPFVSLDEVVTDHHGLEARVRDLRAAGLDVRHFVGYGQPATGIAEAADELHADLILMAPHQRTHLEAWLHPSVTEHAVAHSPVPLLVLPEHALASGSGGFLQLPEAHIVVPLDGSDVGEQALPFALAFARAYHRPLTLLRVVTPRRLAGAGPEGYRISLQAQAQQEHEARTYLASMRRHLTGDRGVAVQSVVLRGDAERMIVHFAITHEGSLFVLSTHGRRGISRLIAGSVSTAVMRASPLPLLMVPPLARADAWENERAQHIRAREGALSATSPISMKG